MGESLRVSREKGMSRSPSRVELEGSVCLHTKGTEVQGPLGLQSKLKASLSDLVRPWVKVKRGLGT